MINNQSVQKMPDVPELQNADDLVENKPNEDSNDPNDPNAFDMMQYQNENADFGLPTDILPQE